VEHTINTGDSRPIRQRSYRHSLSERQTIQQHVSDMLRDGVIEESTSPWTSPVVLVKKKDGSIRFCVDFRKLNSVTKKDVYPLPRIDDALDVLYGSRYFSSLDLKSGYWQVSVAEKDREKTAFSTGDGLFQFRVMPFGLTNAPATFERMMDSVLRGLKWSICLCYLDDILVFSATFDDHLNRLRQVLVALENAGLTLNIKKCHFCSPEIKVLGHVVSASGILPDPEKLADVQNFSTPKSVKQLQSFLGLCSYFRRFVKNFASRVSHLRQLLLKDSEFIWTSLHEDEFRDLKTCLS